MSSKRCSCADCKQKVALVGHCNHCSSDFCLKHRLPEDHSCAQMEAVKKQARDSNATKLMSERTVERKVLEV